MSQMDASGTAAECCPGQIHVKGAITELVTNGQLQHVVYGCYGMNRTNTS